jgi:hypothetical protein
VLRAARMTNPPREQVNPPRRPRLPMALRSRRALCPPRFASRAPNPDSCPIRACRRPSWLARRAVDRRPWRAERRRARPVRCPALCGSAHGARLGRSGGGCRRLLVPNPVRAVCVLGGLLGRCAAPRPGGSGEDGSARLVCVVKPSIASTGWVGLWPACRPGACLSAAHRPRRTLAGPRGRL